MIVSLDHLAILPILLPMLAGILSILIDDRHRTLKAALSLGAVALLCVVAIALLLRVRAGDDTGRELVISYPLGNWPVPFGIVLVADRLAVLMVALTAVLALATLTNALVRWHRVGPSFHALFQFLLMGLNGAFLTGDLFNLFVFFEVLLAASYGLLLHGGGAARVKAALHYVAVNLLASSLFLLGAALLYGVTGTLNMADLAVRIAATPAADRGLLEAGAGILGIAFLVKAGMWPLSFWLPASYSVAAAPVAAMFAIMTKMGVYVVLRLSVLLFGTGAGLSANFGQPILFWGGIGTIVFAGAGVLAAQSTPRLSSYLVLVSSGTLLAAIGLGNWAVTAGALYYLVISTLAIAALFLLVELVERARIAGADVLAVTLEAYGEDEEDLPEGEEPIGIVIPATTALLGISFAVCCILLAGLPPLGGFLGKFAMLSAALGVDGAPSAAAWWLLATLILSGLAVLIAMTRTGISIFWATMRDGAAQVRLAEIAPVLLLLGIAVGLTVFAAPAMGYMQRTAALLSDAQIYVDQVMATPTVGAQTP